MSQAQLIPTASPSPIFNFKNCEIRTVMQDGQPWFVARDVCAALGISWNGTALKAVPPLWQGLRSYRTPSGNQQLKVISEPAVYKLAFRSNKPEADEFTNWVASDVLPAIRKTGQYSTSPKVKRGRKALGTGLPSTPQHIFDRLGLSAWEKVQMGPHIRRMLDDECELGPKTIECILLKARYLKAIGDVHRLGNALFTDLGRATAETYGAAQKTTNKTGTFADPFTDTFYADRYRLVTIANDFFDTAFRAINTSICVARMQGM